MSQGRSPPIHVRHEEKGQFANQTKEQGQRIAPKCQGTYIT